ncbi:MAG: NAD(+) diphosphatase [Pseudomonadota bacterium]
MSVNPMSGLPINRLAERRNDEAWLSREFANPRSRVMVVSEGRVLVCGRGADAQLADLPPALRQQSHYQALLGELDSDTWFVASVSKATAESLADEQGARLRGLRSIVADLEGPQAGLAAYARGLDLWQANHRFCGRCGTRCEIDQAGFRMVCQNPDCGRVHFPRLDPAVIVAVGYRGSILLGRQPSWPPGRYSTLAGFVEPGESLEDAVRREVAEESGVVVGHLSYHSSQPWPFPSSLMVGFIGEAVRTDIRLDDELEDARWFEPLELQRLVKSGEIILPFKASVSWHLIAHFMASRHQLDISSWGGGVWQR